MTGRKNNSHQLPASSQITSDSMNERDLQLETRNDYADWFPRNGYGGYGNYVAEDQINLRDLWSKVFKHKWLIAAIVIVATTAVTIAVASVKPWYRASATVEIGKENSMNLSGNETTGSDATDPFYLVNINTQKLALSSYELLEEVVVDQRLDQNPKIVEAVNKKSLFGVFSKTEDKPLERKEIANVNPTKGKNQKAKTDAAANEQAATGARLAPFVEYLRNHTDVEQVRETRALQVSVTDEDPQFAADITNSITKIFMQRNYSNQTERFNNSADWLDTSTRQLKGKVESAETALANYMRDNQIYAAEIPGTGGDRQKSPTLTTTKLTQLHDQLTRAQTDKMLKQSLYDQLREGRISELPEIFSDPKIVEAEKQLNQLVTQAAELRARFGPANPKIVEIQNQIEALTKQINNSQTALEKKLKADYERAVADEQSLTAALDESKVAAVNENQASIKLNILQQDVDTQRSLYTDFLQKTNQAKAKVAEQNNNIRVIENAQTPTKPVGPKRLILILAGFFLSLGAGIGLAFFIEYLDHTIKSVEDVEQFSQLPVLGLIPKSSSYATRAPKYLTRRNAVQSLSLNGDDALDLPVENAAQLNLLQSLTNHTLVGEAYRALRTSILMSFAGSPPKTILITSCQAGEGKTTTAINTATMLTQLDAKVLLIDCDLRLPSLHRRLDIAPGNGLSTYLSSKTDLDELIQQTDIPNLSVLPCGQIPPNPAELISSNKMREMLKELSNEYDHIILDSPPLLSVTDSVILSGLVDGTILVVSSGKTTREMLQRCRQELYNVHSKILGVVLNRVKLRGDANYRYYRAPEFDSVNV